MSKSEHLDKDSLEILRAMVETLEGGFQSLPPFDAQTTDEEAMKRVLMEVATRLRDNYPYFHPLYAGQMLKPPHAIARLATSLAQWINPNNHALDGGRASSAMEKEAVAQIAAMIGWKEHIGHLTSGGTMANLEALWVAGKLNPGKTILASKQAHYTHERISNVLGLPFESIASDQKGRIDVGQLEQRLARGGVGTVVATIGATATGAVDPLADILALKERFGFRLHADAAYGGYFRLAGNLARETTKSLQLMDKADSVVIDPHKHGLQPYGCGCIVFRDPTVGRFYKHDSPYTYFTSGDLHMGEITLECSRPGASAVGLWATQRLLPLVPKGVFAGMLERSRSAAIALHGHIVNDKRFLTPFSPELDIVVWIPSAPSSTVASDRSRKIFDEAARHNLHLALAELPASFFDLSAAGMQAKESTVTCLRSVLMKPEHAEWIEPIWEILDRSTSTVLSEP